MIMTGELTFEEAILKYHVPRFLVRECIDNNGGNSVDAEGKGEYQH